MASGTDTAKPEAGDRRPRLRWLPGTSLGRLIVALNLLGLAILISGALVLNEMRRGLVNARIDSLTTQGELMATIIDRAATVGEPKPAMDPVFAGEILQMLSNTHTQRARLFDAKGHVLADSDWVADRVEARDLPPARTRDDNGRSFDLDLQMPGQPTPAPSSSPATNRPLSSLGKTFRNRRGAPALPCQSSALRSRKNGNVIS